MKKLLLLTALLVAATFSSCKYDDDDIWNSVHGLENRVTKLEELCKQMNTNISSLQTIVNALQNNDYVTGVAPITKNGDTVGYTISFTKSAPITIYHGQNGKDGINGSDGKDGLNGVDGKDGHTPIIGVRQDSDGIYYWTLDGEWLLNNSGNKVKAEGRDGQDGADGSDGKDGTDGKDGQDGKPGEPGKDGTDGKDGITPQLKIENGYWFVSTDGGMTWNNLGKATGEDGQNGANGADGKDGVDGDLFFKSVDTTDSEFVIFTLADGTTIKLPTWYAFEQLRTFCNQMNTNISALQAIVEALQNNDYVKSVTPIMQDGKEIGCTITFSKINPITIYYGQNGKDGANGSDGKDGHTPVVGVRQDADGVYYWTLDGDWLLDNVGNKVKAEGCDGKAGQDGQPGADGKDGKDGITPQLKIENGYWYVSTDNGSTWTNLGKATGEDGKNGADGSDGKDGIDGDSFFKSVDTSNDDCIIFTLADGTEIKLPTWYAFEQLRTLCNRMNTNISALQTIVTALQENDYVKSVMPVMQDGKEIGYTITFSKSSPITIYHGQNGKDGANGTDGIDGVNGKDGHTPVIGVRQGADGVYYWTLDGIWLLDTAGNKIKAEGRDGNDGQDGADGKDGQNGQPGADGKDGRDGITPQLKIENGYWYVSTDNGSTWTNLGKATGEDGKNGTDGKDGDSIFQSVTQDEDKVYFTLADGMVITLPKAVAFDIVFTQQAGLICEPGGSVRIAYSIIGGKTDTIVECLGKEGWQADIEAESPQKGYVVVAAPTNRSNGKVLVFASSKGQTVMKSLTFGAGVLTGIADAYQIKHTGGKLTIRVTTNLTYTVHVDDDAESWISAAVTRAELRTETLTVTVQPNASEAERVGYFELRSDKGSMLQRVEVIQTARALPQKGYIEFADATVKTVCVTKFDTDGDGELSYEEAAAVTDIGNPFSSSSQIVSFDELQYFTSLTNIPRLFRSCSFLRSVTLPEGLTEVGNEAFYDCKCLQSVRIPDSVKKISTGAFSGCSQLSEIQLPAGLLKIGSRAFENCNNLTELILPDGVNEIGISVFVHCEQLKNINIPYGIVSIPDKTFLGCKSLSKITLPESVEVIGASAFSRCAALYEIVIPKNVRNIGEGIFQDCTALTTVTQLSEKINYITSFMFNGCSSLKKIELPKQVKSIGNVAFSGCKSLKNIDVPSVEKIGYSAFENCSALESIQLNEGLESIYGSVFKGCSNLASLKLPSSVTSIGPHAFAGCEKLPQQDLSHVKSIGQHAFEGCLQWTEAVLPAGLPYMEAGVFKGCANLTKVTIPSTVERIGEGTFFECKSLQTVVVPEGVNSIGSSAFKGCCSLVKVVVPKLVTKLANETFSGCTGLTEVVLSEGLQTTGKETFAGCTSLKSIELPSTITTVGDRSFMDCTSLVDVYCDALTPPKTYTQSNNSFLNTPQTQLFVPKGSADAYKTTGAWAEFKTIIEQ